MGKEGEKERERILPAFSDEGVFLHRERRAVTPVMTVAPMSIPNKPTSHQFIYEKNVFGGHLTINRCAIYSLF